MLTKRSSNFQLQSSLMNGFKILTITHHKVSLDKISKYVIPQSEEKTIQEQLSHVKEQLQLKELLYIPTCNRVIFLLYNDASAMEATFVPHFIKTIHPHFSTKDIQESVEVYEGEEAILHFHEVASSIDSLVVGEREIMRQIRDAYTQCKQWALTGDNIRILMKHLVQTIKEVYTSTRIGENPVSVVSLAMGLLKKRKLSPADRILLVGAGQTNSLVAKFLVRQGFKNIQVFNRSIEKANKLAQFVKGNAYLLSHLEHYTAGFDCMIICTGATQSIIDSSLYSHLLQGDKGQKVVIDLAIPNNIAKQVLLDFKVDYISIEELKELAELNLSLRKQEIGLVKMLLQKRFMDFEKGFKGRQIEIAMQEVPQRIKKVKAKAMNEVFKKELEELDEPTLALVEKMMTYMEKKCISIPMMAAKDLKL